MEKPFTVCHMLASVNGKISGEFMSAPAARSARDAYASIREQYACPAVLYGLVTMRGGFADGLAQALPPAQRPAPRGTWRAPSDTDRYVIAMDPAGTLAWSSPYMEKKGRPRAHVIEAVTESVSGDYLAYLRRTGVSYVVAGDGGGIDCTKLLTELQSVFGVERLLVAGGGYTNGALLQAGLLDEISIVQAPVTEGDPASVTTFETPSFAAGSGCVGLTMKEVRALEGGGVWLRCVPNADAGAL